MWILDGDGESIPGSYNQYGELVSVEALNTKPLVAKEHTVAEMLRKIKIEFRSDFRAKMREIILPQMDLRTIIRTYIPKATYNVSSQC